MRDFFCFKNAREFRELFGMRYVNGCPVGRNNKILLSFLKSKDVFNFDKSLMGIRSMPELKNKCNELLLGGSSLFLMDKWYSLTGYNTDERYGICEDLDTTSVRVLHDYKLVKIRAGKLFRKIILENDFGKCLPEQVITYLCEEFSRDWETYAKSKCQKEYVLLTGLDSDLTFADIYGNGKKYMADYMGSCMTGRNRHAFYDTSMADVYPAALVRANRPKNIVARCVVYNHVTDVDSGEVLRLAERQYSSIGEFGQRLLVNALKDKGLIDGHKFIGASCHEGTNFVLNDGTYIGDKTLSVRVDFSKNKILSYQDSFKYYNHREKTAYNKCPDRYSINLASTDNKVDVNFDSYHNEEIIGRVNEVFVGGKRLTCAAADMRDFFPWGNFWFHKKKDSQKCPHCGGLMGSHHNEMFHSKITGENYCCSACKNETEMAIGDARYFFAAFEKQFVRRASELTTAMCWTRVSWSNYEYQKMSIKKTTLDALLAMGYAVKRKGTIYVGVNSQGDLCRAY